MNNQKAICLITYKPNELNIEFLNNFINYDIFIIIDDNENDYKELKIKYENIKFIQINNENCLHYGFKNTSTITLNKVISGWDKALFFFSITETSYHYIWFMEDDVYFYNENSLMKIDNAYKNEDLLCNSSFDEAKLNEWLWNRIQIQFQSPYYCGMMCICRFSKKMLQSIIDYAVKNHTLFFLEALFPTIAVKYNLCYYKNPEEFSTVTHRNLFELSIFNKTSLYHPVKNIESHKLLRTE
jgi:hypothetical protein